MGMAKPVILYFGNDWNAANRTSSHHIARRLAGQHEVYYIECPGMRRARSSARDLRRIFQKLGAGCGVPVKSCPGSRWPRSCRFRCIVFPWSAG